MIDLLFGVFDRTRHYFARLEDLLGGFGPGEGFGVVVPGVGPGSDIGGEFFHVAVGRPL